MKVKNPLYLAKERGAFPLFFDKATRRELFIGPFKDAPSQFVSIKDWEELEFSFNTYGIRNLATTILPPTGRSSIIAGVTPSIEPPFRLVASPSFKEALTKQCTRHGYKENLETIFDHIQETGTVQETMLPNQVKEIFKTALEISFEDHLRMTAAFQAHTDEGISKTINLPKNSTIDDVVKAYQLAYQLKLKGVTIYRDSCRDFQPKALNIRSREANTIVDSIYGPVQVSDRVMGLIKSPLVQRLKGVHQNGSNHLIDPRQSTSRYDHSVGTLILVQRLGGSESEQVAALLHDISHTAFSHVIDLVFSNKDQNYHDLIRNDFFRSQVAQEAIKKFSITEKELSPEEIPFVKGASELNIDRLDYCIRDLKAVNKIYHPEYSSILNNLVIEDQQIKCKNLATARLLFNKFLIANKEIYFDHKSEAAAVALSAILRKMLQSNFLSERDFFLPEQELVKKITSSPFREQFSLITPNISFFQTEKPTDFPPVLRKLRYVDPIICGEEKKLTSLCKDSRNKLDQYFKTKTTIYYNLYQ